MPSGRKTKVKPAPTVASIRDRAILNICSTVNRVISVHERRIGTSGVTLTAYDEISSGSGAYDGSNEDLKETVQELAKTITIRRRKQVAKAKEKEEQVVAQATRRRGGMRGNAITEGLVSLLDLGKKQRDQRWLGFDAENFFMFDINVPRALLRTSTLITKMLLAVTIASSLSFASIRIVNMYVQMSTREVGDGDNAAARAATVEVLALLFGWWQFWNFLCISLFTGLSPIQSLFCALPNPLMVLPVYFFSSSASSLFFSVYIVVVGGFTVSLPAYFMIVNNEREKMNIAVRNTKKDLAGQNAEEVKQSKGKLIRLIFFLCMPILFVLGTTLTYTLVVFRMFRAVDSNFWMLAVTMFAQAIKIAGNKVMLVLLSKQSEFVDPWYMDFMLFFYEETTALLCRVLQLSIEDRDTAIFCSVFGALAEMAVRVFYFQLFLSHGLKKDGQWESESEIFSYALRGKMRALDSSNDMIVEYLSSITGALFLVELQHLGVFQFAAEETIDSSRVWSLVFIQLLPELPIDFFMTFIEIFGGLSLVHEANWSHETGKRKVKTYFWLDLGDFTKSIVVKMVVSSVVCTAILIFSAR